MNRLFFYLFSLVCLMMCTTLVRAQSDTTYFNDENLEVPGWDYADYCRVNTKRADGKYDVKEYYSNNKLMSVGVYSDSGHRDGYFTNYSRRGVKKAEGAYKNDKPVGEHKEYYGNSGELHVTEHYNDTGERTGELAVYYENGNFRRKESFDAGKSISGKCYDEAGKEVTYFPFDVLPEFPGGEKQLLEYLANNTHYPVQSREDGIQGVVYCSFVINELGAISSIKILKSPGPEFEAEVVRLIVAMPKWKPGMHDGAPVKVYFTLPVTFRLE